MICGYQQRCGGSVWDVFFAIGEGGGEGEEAGEEDCEEGEGEEG